MDDIGQPVNSADETVTHPSDARLRTIIDRSMAFMGALTPAGILTEANEPALRAAGLVRDEVIGKPFWDTYWWNYDVQVQDRLKNAIARAAQGETVRYEEDIRVTDDRRMVIAFQISPYRAEDGTIAELIPSGIDITEHKRNERAAKSARDTFENMVKNSPFGVFVVDADFRISLVARGAQKAFRGVDPLIERDLAEALRTIWPEPFATEAIGHFRRTLATGEPHHEPSTVETRKDVGVVEAYDWQTERIILPDGSNGVVCHFYDLSEHEKYESALRASEAKFRATFENAAVGIGHNAPDGKWLRVNQKLCDILGYNSEELINMTYKDITHPDDLAADMALVERINTGALDEFQIKKRYLRKDGATVWVNLTVSCVRNDGGDLNYYIAVIEDISEQIAAQQQEQLLVRELNHRIKNTLATVQAMASHTLRNAATPEEFRIAFSGRLRAIASAHDSIFETGKGSADMKSLIESQLAGYGAAGGDRLLIRGPNISLTANRAHGLGLILHELSTNAAKYGALSNDTGRIDVELRQTGQNMTELIWTESGGPDVSPSGRQGFGSRLIATTIEQTLNGTANFDYRRDGLQVTLRLGPEE